MTLWTAILLVCSEFSCVAVGGPAVATERHCWGTVDSGVDMVLELYGDGVKIVDAVCISWGTDA